MTTRDDSGQQLVRTRQFKEKDQQTNPKEVVAQGYDQIAAKHLEWSGQKPEGG